MAEPATPSKDAIEILKLLRDSHNVLISGPPGTGKSRLLNEVARWFKATSRPAYDPDGEVAIPEDESVVDAQDWLPSPERTDREVFTTAFHQGSKYRDLLRGLVPEIGAGISFGVSSGTLYRASVHALTEDGAALLVIDEINRGPAVQVFGDSIVAIESDKRLGENGLATPTTQHFELLSDKGAMEAFAIPYHVYLLGAMNEADTSVEPLDVAFLRRWEPFRLEPDTQVLVDYFGIDASTEPPVTPASHEDVYTAAIRAWIAVNDRISLARGQEYRIGHGVFMVEGLNPPDDLGEALGFVARGWRRVRKHINEVFFGDVRGAAAALGIGAAGHPYELFEGFFAGAPVSEIRGPDPLDKDELYRLLIAVAQEPQ